MGHTILYDVTVTHPSKSPSEDARSCDDQELRRPGAAPTLAEEHKNRKYANKLIRPDVSTFVPLGFDVCGG